MGTQELSLDSAGFVPPATDQSFFLLPRNHAEFMYITLIHPARSIDLNPQNPALLVLDRDPWPITQTLQVPQRSTRLGMYRFCSTKQVAIKRLKILMPSKKRFACDVVGCPITQTLSMALHSYRQVLCKIKIYKFSLQLACASYTCKY